MTSAPSSELRPRSAVELFDAATKVTLEGRTAAGLVAALGTLPFAVSALALFWWTLRGDDERIRAALAVTTGATFLLRYVGRGAASLALDAAIAGERMDAGEALARALARLPSFFAAGGVLLLHALAGLCTFGLSRLGSAPCAPAIALVARGEARPLSAARAARRALDGAHDRAIAVELLQLVAFGVIVLDLQFGAFLLLAIARGTLDVDVGYAARFASPDNPVWIAALAAISLCLLEPLRAVSSHLLLLDSRIRRDGLDLVARARALRAAGRERRAGASTRRHFAALLAAGWLGLLAAPGHAAAAGPDPDLWDDPGTPQAELFRASGGSPAQRLAHAARFAGAPDDVVERLGRASGDAAALARWADRIERSLGALPPFEGEARSRAAERVVGELASAAEALDADASAADGAKVDAGRRLQEILSRPEFRELVRGGAPQAADEPPEFVEALRRAWQEFLRWLRERFEEEPREPKRPDLPVPGVPPGLLDWLTGGFAVLAVAALLLWIRRWPRRSAAPAAAKGPSTVAAPAESALSRSAAAWWRRADELAARGEHREAMRALYLGVLAALHGRGAIAYDASLSNWEHHRAFRGGRDEHHRFGELTRRFDWGVYGRIGADRSGYDAMRGLALPLAETVPEPTVAGSEAKGPGAGGPP